MKDEINEMVHFEIPARDPKKLRKFYADVFGWKFKNSAPQNMQYWNIDTKSKHMPAVGGGLYKKGSPKERPVNYISTPDIDKSIAQIKRAGGRITVGKKETPDHGWTAVGTDPEGNPVGLFQPVNKGLFREKGTQSQSGANRIRSSRRNDRTPDTK
jgi:predicted enzyme related to lactoylglutathione lyase